MTVASSVVYCLIVAMPLAAGAAPAEGPATTAATAGAPAGDAARCPVMPWKPVTAEHQVQYQGRAVQFCCERCVEKFLLDPGRYAANLSTGPHDPAGAGAAPTAPRAPLAWGDLLRDLPKRSGEFLERHRVFVYAVVAVFALYLVAARAQRSARARAKAGVKVGPAARLLTPFARPLVVVAAVLLLVIGQLGFDRLERDAAVRAAGERQAAADVSAGRAHAAAEFAVEMMRQGMLQGPELTGRLKATYYRGNDERDEQLFNGGKYRTATFHVGLVDAENREVGPGDDVAGRQLLLRVELERAPYTSDAYFTPAVMAEMFLARYAVRPWMAIPPPSPSPSAASAEPQPEPVFFSAVEPDRRWVAVCPLGVPQTDTAGPDRHELEGVVLLNPGGIWTSPDDLFASAHYGVCYRLRVQGGRLAEPSRLWMASLYFTESLPDDRVGEWFDFRPIPELPGPPAFPDHGEADGLTPPPAPPPHGSGRS